jgi:hypothetical protein
MPISNRPAGTPVHRVATTDSTPVCGRCRISFASHAPELAGIRNGRIQQFIPSFYSTFSTPHLLLQFGLFGRARPAAAENRAARLDASAARFRNIADWVYTEQDRRIEY